MRCTRLLLFIFVFVVLTGCDQHSPESMLEDYVDRVGNTLDLDAQSGKPYEHLQAFPDRRDRRLTTTELRTGLLETLSLADCQLLPLIAERNSSLGKVMKPSTQLSYELRFFSQLESCYRRYRSNPDTDEEFMRLLNEIYKVKAANLEAVIWNGTFTSEAMEQNFSLSKDPVPLTGNPGYGNALRALQFFHQIADNLQRFRSGQSFRLPPDLKQLEKHYFALHNSEYGGQLILSLALITHHLDQVTELLNRKLQKRPLCFKSQPTNTAKILKNILIKYYAGEVQPYIARVQRHGQDWLETINGLLTHGIMPTPPLVERYRLTMLDVQGSSTLWGEYQRAVEAHTDAWQQVLRQCGLMPGS
ncbi:MAG: DUF3080 domain-containing protein [Motiliproteus sp.]|nr:DUF3080 domain-containing protein [Motiliproteus sp.]MCW9051091.1 DUF3080 domain-containing protein [Motiliproteus sp.]